MNMIKKITIILLISMSFLTIGFSKGCNPNVDGIKWYHDSAEKKALYIQAYNVASQKIKHEVATQKLKKGEWGIILDVDETTLDDSWVEYSDYKNYEFNENIYLKVKGVATPGVVKFTHFIHNLGGLVSFVTNRHATDEKIIEATVRNLEKEDVYLDQVLFSNPKLENKDDKNPRFKAVETGKYNEDIITTSKLPPHMVIAYFGDNIQDFPNLKQKDMAKANEDAFKGFGNKYFIVPNSMYGSWM